jgi:hypothetical protein
MSQSFELPPKIEKILASLSGYYSQNDMPTLQRLIVNSSYHVHEEWVYESWVGGTDYGHAIFFNVPSEIYYEIFDNLDSIAQELRERINQISHVQNEYIHEVFLELQEDSVMENWRENSGVLIHASSATAVTPEDQLSELWTPGCLRLFISHKAKYKKQASELKDALDYYGVSSFVAHEDIEPTKEWQNEIEKALFSMDAIVALLTDDFNSSEWTDQEIGVAICQRVPVIPIQLGMDPYGFIGKYQALIGHNKDASSLAKEIYELFWTKSSLKERLIESLVTRFEDSESFRHTNDLMEYICRIENTSPQIIDRLEKAPENNLQVKDAWAVERTLPHLLQKLRGER